MEWKFWKKDNIVINKVEELDEKISALQNNINDIRMTNKQMNRLQYKQTQNILESIERLDQRLKKQEIDQELIADLKKDIEGCRESLTHNANVLIDFIDEFDLIRQGLGDNEERWSDLLDKWVARLLKLLNRQGIYQLELLNKEFNPRMAEAVSIIRVKDLPGDENYSDNTYNNHDIVEIIKRGYRDKQGELIRKAIVIIYKEGDNE